MDEKDNAANSTPLTKTLAFLLPTDSTVPKLVRVVGAIIVVGSVIGMVSCFVQLILVLVKPGGSINKLGEATIFSFLLLLSYVFFRLGKGLRKGERYRKRL